ncbi:MAG: DUF4058 family protein [Planctomycetota bacterium]|nr:DUF4058 family protein [Planctomycetota bacterium]
MASPFPGMDPYLEQFWRDVHARLIIYAADQLQGRLPGDLRARVEERVVVESGAGEERNVYPDIRIVERGRGPAGAATTETDVAVLEPVILRLENESMTETFIEVIDVGSGKRVVTVIEVLSLANKLPGDGQEKYRQKQDELRAGGVSLVELDLLRTGQRRLGVPYRRLPISHRTAYQVCVRRGWDPAAVEVYPVPIRQRLPTVRIPLRQTDAEVPLDLQTLIEQCYRNGGYDADLDYHHPPQPPLTAEDDSWADNLLRSQGRR